VIDRGDLRTRQVLGVPIAAITMSEAIEHVQAAIAARRSLQIGVVNAAKLVNMRRDPDLRADVLACDLVLADGMAVVWASRVLGGALPERVAGIDLMFRMLERGNELGYRIFCLGATPEVLAAALAVFRRDYPSVVIAGSHHGYFSPQEEPAVAAQIASSKADILIVGMTSPRKEQFIARWGDSLGVTVCHGVGGSLDVVAGKVQRAPAAWQRLGLEWLYRVKQEPRRLWRRYLVTNTRFVSLVLSEWFQLKVRRPERFP
jgi:N-acetylglucosaminyldiphosphoundecaprenol N-acetyl-beta-D-mannosaminyltransferase